MTQEDWVWLARKMYGDSSVVEGFANYLRFQGKWKTFGEVWEWATRQEWWPKFAKKFLSEVLCHQDRYYRLEHVIDPTRFPELVVKFLREREKGEGK